MRNYNFAFKTIIAIFVIYACFFIYQSSIYIDGERYFTLADDQMVSMRYAKNFANGDDLVWNKGGERIEGFTNPLWTLYMSYFHYLQIPASKICLLIQISGLLFLLLNLFVIRSIAEKLSEKASFVSICSVLFTAFYLPLNYWSLHGFEVSILTLIISLSILCLIKSKDNNLYIYASYVLLGIGTCIRIDMIVPFAVCLLYISYLDDGFVSSKKKVIFYGFAILSLFVISQTILRYFYYGDILPNTYYLKMTGYPIMLRIIRGFLVFIEFVWKSNWILMLLPLLLLTQRSSKYIKLLFMFIVGQVVYSIYTGGDAWEWWEACNRFIVIVMPLFFILLSIAIFEIYKLLNQTMLKEVKLLLRKTMVITFVVLSVCSLNSMNGIKGIRNVLLLKAPYQTQEHWKYIDIALFVNDVTKPEAKIAVVWAGITPYFVDRYCVDLLGKTDKRIAKGKTATYEESSKLFIFNNITRSRYTHFYPGHLKWDYEYSIKQLQPDVIVELWGDIREIRPFLLQNYLMINYKGHQMFLLRNSKNIRWDLGFLKGETPDAGKSKDN